MKLWNFLYTIILIACLFAACTNSAVVAKHDYEEPVAARTYAWIATKADPRDEFPRPISYADNNMRKAVANYLGKLGWREVSSHPDLLVSYDVLIEKTPAQVNGPIDPEPLKSLYFNPTTHRWVNLPFPSQFSKYQLYEVPPREAVVMLHITDARTDQLLWQAWTLQKMDYTRFKQTEVNKSVRNIFNKLDLASR
jgi:hypothetical protein